MKFIRFIFLLILFSCPSYGQEIIGGPTSPDLKNLPPYPLVNLILKVPNDTPITNIDWLNLSIINNQIIAHTGINCGNDYIFTGPPGSYLIICNYNKNTRSTINLTIPKTPGPEPPKPPDIIPPDIPKPPDIIPPKPVPIPIPISTKVFSAMIANTSSPKYIGSSVSTIWTSQTITPLLNNINVSWKHYDINSKVNDGKGNLIPLSQSSWGKEGLKLINDNNIASMVLVDNKGVIIDSIILPPTEQETITYIKTKLGR